MLIVSRMPTPAPGTAISFSQVNTEFTLTTPSPMNNNYRFAPGTYTPATPAIPTTASGIFPMDVLHGRTKASITPFTTTFTAPTTWTATFTGNIRVIVVGGGGSGGTASVGPAACGGGGGGGVIYNASVPVINGTVYPITVGAQTTASPTTVRGNPSAFSTLVTAAGGGAGGVTGVPATLPLRPGLANGASGGGGAGNSTAFVPNIPGGTGTAPGTAGGSGSPLTGGTSIGAGGGGGAGTAGVSASGGSGGPGGAGRANEITGVVYGGGGGGGSANGGTVTTGGPGGGGAGARAQISSSVNGTANTGGGGGGGSGTGPTWTGGTGGSGIVIIAYP